MKTEPTLLHMFKVATLNGVSIRILNGYGRYCVHVSKGRQNEVLYFAPEQADKDPALCWDAITEMIARVVKKDAKDVDMLKRYREATDDDNT